MAKIFSICKSLEEYSERIQCNIESDRAQTSVMLFDMMLILKKDPEKYREFGLVVAKFMEVLQRSNEQLVKLASITHNKKSEQNANLSSEEKEEIFDYFQKKDKKEVGDK